MFQSFLNLFTQKYSSTSDSPESVSDPESVINDAETASDTRTDGKVSFGCALYRGRRPKMEDYHDSQFTQHSNGAVVGFFGVFDGHGGCSAARFVSDNLLNNLLQHPRFVSDLESALKESYTRTDEEFLNSSNVEFCDDGCTAVTAVIVDRKLVVGNVGDSRAVLCVNGKAIQLSVDHKPNHDAEKERIEKLGGMVCWAGTWRVSGMLAVSRAFGNRLLKKFVVANPFITTIEELNNDHEFLILATDGIWDVINNEEAVQMIYQEPDPKKAALYLTDMAINRGSTDNISCTVIRFSFMH
eukprot:g7851.t1